MVSPVVPSFYFLFAILFCFVLPGPSLSAPSLPFQKVLHPLHICPLRIWSWRHGLFPSSVVSLLSLPETCAPWNSPWASSNSERAVGHISEMYPPWGCSGPEHSLLMILHETSLVLGPVTPDWEHVHFGRASVID